MENQPLTPSGESGATRRFRRWTRSWLLLFGLLALCVVTATSFFLATADIPRSRPSDTLPQPTRGGVFRVPLPDAPILTLDPARAAYAPDIMLVEQLYDGLTAFDEHLNVVPALARYWEISSDGRVYTFELRPDARFHNGRPVTADDCVQSVQRLLDPALNKVNYHYFSRIEGAQEFREGLARTVYGLRALDERTFQMRFTSPFVPALLVMSMYCSKILPGKELLEKGEDFFLAPIGTGPFRFSRWIRQEEDPAVPIFGGLHQAIRLEANRQYFGHVPYLDAVVFRSLWSAPNAPAEEALDERFDFLPGMEEEPRGWVPVETDRHLAIHYLVLPADVPPYDDPRIRRAIGYALDKREFLDSSPYTNGAAAATTIVPPGIPGFLPLDSGQRHDLGRAKQLLEEAGYPMGRGLPPLELPTYREDLAAVGERTCIKSCLAKIGVEVKELRLKRYFEPGDKRFRGRPVVYETGWIADFPDPDNFLRPLFYSTSPVNLSGYRSPDVDRLLDEAWSQPSYSARNRLYRRIEKIVLHELPVVPLYHGALRYLVRPNVRGFLMSPLGLSYLQLSRVWLAEERVTGEAGS